MQSSQSHPGTVGYLLLVVAFIGAGLVFATAGIRAWSQEGFSAPAVIAALAVLGTMSLAQRYVKLISLERQRVRRR